MAVSIVDPGPMSVQQTTCSLLLALLPLALEALAHGRDEGDGTFPLGIHLAPRPACAPLRAQCGRGHRATRLEVLAWLRR